MVNRKRHKATLMAAALAALFNVALAGLYLWLEPHIPLLSWPREAVFGTIAAVSIGATVLAVLLSGRTATIVANVQLSVASCLLTLLMLEAAFRLVPSVFSDNIRLLVEQDFDPKSRDAIVEQLPFSPFAKPKANATVFIPGYYGPKGTFV